MTQKNSNAAVIGTLVVCTIILAFIMFATIPVILEQKEGPTANDIAVELLGMVNIPTAEDIAGAINVPSTDNDMIDKLCELTDGCEFWEGEYSDLINLDSDEAWEDFEEALSNLVDVDEDYLEYDVDYSFDDFDYQVRAYSENDRDDENWECKIFVRVEYTDTDTDDDEVIYVLIDSTLDEGEYDELSIKEVSRNFEFD